MRQIGWLKKGGPVPSPLAISGSVSAGFRAYPARLRRAIERLGSAMRSVLPGCALCRMEPGVSSAASRGRQYARLTAQSLRTRQSCGSLRGIACNRDPLGDAAGVRRTMTGPYDYQ